MQFLLAMYFELKEKWFSFSLELSEKSLLRNNLDKFEEMKIEFRPKLQDYVNFLVNQFTNSTEAF